MVSEWRKVSLKDVADDITVGFVGPMASEYVPNGIPFLRSQNVLPHRISLQDIKFISDEFYQKIKKSALTPGDVVIVRTGKPGTAAVIPDTLPVSNCSDLVIVRPGNELNAKFLSYYMNGIGQHHVSAHLVGAVQQHFNVGSAREMKIFLPSRVEQDQIVGVLSVLDDKIELNRHMNETLEAMAKALFKSWFVDFDPVRAKAEGRPPEGLTPDIAALFPDAFDAQEQPIGWGVGKLEDLLVLQRGFDLPSSSRTLGKWPVIAASGPSGTHNEFMVKGPGVVTGRSGVLGKVFFVPEDFWPLNTSLWVKNFKLAGPYYAYFLLSTIDFSAFNSGSAVPTLNRNHVHSLPVILPPNELITIFEEIAKPLFQAKQEKQAQSETLATIRDSLLPKLMSGAIRVQQAEAIVEAAL